MPFFGELGSINPLVVLPTALEHNSETLAKTLAASITLGCGQFCTSPGLIVVLESPQSQHFVAQLAEAIAPIGTHRMLTAGMQKGFEAAVATVAQHATPVFDKAAQGAGPAPQLFATDAEALSPPAPA